MSLAPGLRLGGYEIVSLVGAGGMGEVYRARDTRLNRDVALKILPSRMADDPLAFARFQREAQAVAALSHPNILAIHDFGREAGWSFVVFELLAGATLRERMANGPLPLRKAIDYGGQVADGLAAAHEKGITHRDIKPDNVFVTDDGRVKILDFGLAQTTQTNAGADAMTQAPVTEAGTLLGTVGYMAPEQVRGQAVDPRADLFALGCVLYEMCSGTRAFMGATPADTLAAVLSSDAPDLSLVGQAAPPALDRIVRRCLEKSPGERFQSARDLSFALDGLASLSGTVGEAGAGAAAAAPPQARTRMAAAAGAALGIGVLAGRLLWSGTDAPAVTTPVSLRAEFESPLGNDRTMFMELSPDGRYLLHSEVAPDSGRRFLVVRNLATGLSTPVPESTGGQSLDWSPRSDAVLFLGEAPELRRFRLGDETTSSVVGVTGQFRGATWLPDDTVVFATTGNVPLQRVPVAGGAVTPVVTTPTLAFLGPSRIGQRSDYVLALQGLAAGGPERNVVVVRLADGQVTEIVRSDAEPAWSSGHLLLPRANGLFALAFDAGTLQATGDPLFVNSTIVWEPGLARSSLAASEAGVIAFRPGKDRALQFEWFDLRGKSLGRVGPQALYGSFSLSPDGTRVIARQIGDFGSAPTGARLVLIDLVRGVTSPVNTPDGPVSDPIWTADGTRIVYRQAERLLRQSPYSNIHETLREGLVYPDAFSADGRWFIGGASRPDGGFGLAITPSDGKGQPQVLTAGLATTDEGSFSPDGKLVSYQSNQTGRVEIFLARFPLTDDRWQVSSEGGMQPRWSADGRTLYYLNLEGQLMKVSVPPGRPEATGRADRLFQLPIDSPSITLEQYFVHGDRLLVLRPAVDSVRQTIAIVSNWTQGLPQAGPRESR